MMCYGVLSHHHIHAGTFTHTRKILSYSEFFTHIISDTELNKQSFSKKISNKSAVCYMVQQVIFVEECLVMDVAKVQKPRVARFSKLILSMKL